MWIQTFTPEAPPIQAAADGRTFAAFAASELAARREGCYPPYCHLAALVFRAQDERLSSGWADLYARALKGYAASFNRSRAAGQPAFHVSDAVPAALAKTEGWFRHQVVIRAPRAQDIVQAVKWIEAMRPAPSDLRIIFDVDALNLL